MCVSLTDSHWRSARRCATAKVTCLHMRVLCIVYYKITGSLARKVMPTVVGGSVLYMVLKRYVHVYV
jgi:hypothetical protein